MALPDGREVLRETRRAKPRLRIDLRAVIVRRIDQLIGPGEANWKLARAFQVATPPVRIVAESLDALDDDQPIRIDLEDGVSCAFSRQAPVGPDIAIPPGGRSTRLVVQVRADYPRLRLVAASQHFPVIDPSALGDPVRIPEFALLVCARAMTIEDDHQLPLHGAIDDPVHQLKTAESLQIRVLRKIDRVRRARRLEQLIAERKADRVEAGASDLVKHAFPGSRPEAMGCEERSLEPKPVHPGEADLCAIAVDQLAPLGPDRTQRRGRSRRRC